jgi:predicted nucleotidyltransferase
MKMPENRNKILAIIHEYLDKLNESGFNIDQAYLFGSFSQGNPNEWSDIDVAIIADKFEGNRFLDKEKIRGININIDPRLSVLPLNFESLNSFFYQKEIIQKGIRIV